MSTCTNCGSSGFYYMATEEVWAAGLRYHDNVCMPCLEKRLRRPLAEGDFVNAPINWDAVPQFFPVGKFREWRERAIANGHRVEACHYTYHNFMLIRGVPCDCRDCI